MSFNDVQYGVCTHACVQCISAMIITYGVVRTHAVLLLECTYVYASAHEAQDGTTAWITTTFQKWSGDAVKPGVTLRWKKDMKSRSGYYIPYGWL